MQQNNLHSIKHKEKTLLHIIELVLAGIVIIGVIFSLIQQAPRLISLDWSQTATFIEFIQVLLYLAVGVELARLLASYNINTVIELMVFVLARKVLLFDESPFALIAIVFSTVLLFGARYFFTKKQ